MISPRTTNTLRTVFIVVPARNEEQLIGRCLASIHSAVVHATTAWGAEGPQVKTVVVADNCSDTTAHIAAQFNVHVLEAKLSNVGSARAAGIEYLLGKTSCTDHREIWLANTDADSVVPFNWLTAQLAYAAAHTELMIGTVRPDFADLTHEQIFAWQSLHTPGSPNGHVHGANLGIRMDAYRLAGGFLPLHEHEDVSLAQRLDQLGATIVATDLCEVVTSGRAHGRTPGGYARYLAEDLIARSLAAEYIA
jgi:glycosyltransferase involved in cell wall biosynthesis